MIYFVIAESSGAIKIGKADNPESRMASLQTGSPEQLSLLGSFPGGVAEERQLHERFAAHRLRGEWFRGHDDIFTYIYSCRRPVTEMLKEKEYRFWVIDGEAESGSSGGEQTVLCVWTEYEFYPNPSDALRAANPSCSWYRISKIQDLSDFPASWGVGEETVRQILLNLPPNGARGFAYDPGLTPIRFIPVFANSG